MRTNRVNRRYAKKKNEKVKRLQLHVIINFKLLLASSGWICNVELQNKVKDSVSKAMKLKEEGKLGFEKKTFIVKCGFGSELLRSRYGE